MATPNPFEKYFPELEALDTEPAVEDSSALPEPGIEAPDANPFEKYFPEFGQQFEPVAPPPEELGTIANLWAGLKERGTELAANLPGGIQTYGQALEGVSEESMLPSLGGIVHHGGLDFDYLTPEEWRKYSEDGGRMGLRELQEEWENTSHGFTPNAAENWEILKTNAGLWEKAQAAGAFALETGVISLADMAGAVIAPPAYIISRAEEIAQERAVQAGRPGRPNNDDLQIALGAATLIQAMERFGFEKIAEAWTKGGPALQRILTAGVAEGATEAVQEPLEFAAETYGTPTEEGMTTEEYQMAALERSAQGALGGGPVGTVLATPPVLLEKAGMKDPTISPDVKSTEENRNAITRALNEQAMRLEQEQVIQDERTMLEEEEERARLIIEREAAEVDARDTTYKTAAHAEVKLQQLEKKYGETRLFPSQIETGEWILEPYGMHSARQKIRERDEQLGVGLRPAEEGQIEVTEGEQITPSEPAPTTEGIEVGEEIVATEPAPTTEGIEVTEEPPYGGGLIPEPTARRIAVTEEQAEEVIATEPAPTTEGIEVEEVTPEEPSEGLPQIGVEEVTEGEETIELKGNRIYQRKPPKDEPPDDEGPGGGGAPVEGGGPITPSILSGAIAKGRSARPEVEGELAQVESQLADIPTNIEVDKPGSEDLMQQAHDLRIQRRDLMDERDFRVKPEEAKQARKEFWKKLREAGLSVKRYESIEEMRKRLADKKVNKVAEAGYNRVVKAIAAAEEEGAAPTVEYLQKKTGLNAKAAKKHLDRYNAEVAGEPDTTPLVSPETATEQTQEAAEAVAAEEIEGRESTDTEAQIAGYNFAESNPAFTGSRFSHKPGDVRFDKTLGHYYGDIDGTVDADGDPVDVILNKDFELEKEYPIFIVNLVDPKTGDFEQHKVLAGFDDILEAEDAANEMYPDQVEDITKIEADEFGTWLNSERTQQPFDRDQFRAELSRGQDLRKPATTDNVLDPTELGTSDAGPVDHSPWLLADGSIVETGGDHMGYVMGRGIEAESATDVRAISRMQQEAGGVRSAFFYDDTVNTQVAWLHLHDDQTLTDEQIAAVEAYGKAARKAGRKVRVLIGSTPTYRKGDDPVNPVVKKSSIAGLKREFGARRARYRADMKKFYAGLAEKTARYSQAAVGRMRAELKPDPTRDELVTFLRKLGGINFLYERQLRSLEEDYRQLNKNYRLPGLPGIVQTDGTGLNISQAAEAATEAGYLPEPREGEGTYDDNAMLDALTDALQGGVLYSQQNEQWIKDVWEEEQQRELERMEDEAKADAEYLMERGIPEDMGELMALAAQFDKAETEDIVSREEDENVVKQQLTDLINERKAQRQAKGAETEEGTPTDAGVEAEAPETARAEPVREGREKPAEEPDAGDYGNIAEYPWQELAAFHDVEILEPPSPDYEGPRTFIIDVYSDKQRTKFVRQVFAANYFKYRDVEQAYRQRFGDDTYIEINKNAFDDQDGHHNLHGHISDGKLNKPYRKLVPIERIKDERAGQRKKERQRREAGWLTPEQWGSTVERYTDELMAEPDPRDVVKHWGEEFKKKGTERNYISHAEGKAKVEEWKQHAKEVGQKIDNSQRVILSLFDVTGEWAQPWIDAGYDVRAIDLKRDDVDIMDIDYGWMRDMGFLEGPGLWGILAACPCTDFTGTGARDWTPGAERPSVEGGKDFIGKTHSSVDLVEQTLAIIDFMKPRFWALENPVGRIKDITGVPEPRLSFNPNNYGDPYTKKTQIYGNFNADLPTANVDPRKENGGMGSKMHSLGSKDELDGGLRSVTPEGFAYAFFMANNDLDNPVADEIIRKEFVRTIPEDVKEKDPNIERKVELVAKLAMLDGTYPTEADLADGTVTDYHSGNYRLEDTDNWPKWAKILIDDVQAARAEDWRIDDGNIATVRELNHLDQEIRTLLNVGQKKSVQYPQKPERDVEPVETLNDLGEPYTNEDFAILDPYMMEAAVDAVNIALEDLAAQGYTFDELRGEPRMSMPDYLANPMDVITSVASGAIPVAKGLKSVQRGRIKPENALNRLFTWKKRLDEATGQIIVPEGEFKQHIRDEYPYLAAALDGKTDDDPGVAMRRQVPDAQDAKAEMYESLGQDELAWQPVPERTPAEAAPEAEAPPAPRGEPTEEAAWQPVEQLERPPEVDINGVLEASTQGEGTDLTNIALTATDGERSVTHNAKWFKDAVDSRLEKLNKIRGCA